MFALGFTNLHTAPSLRRRSSICVSVNVSAGWLIKIHARKVIRRDAAAVVAAACARVSCTRTHTHKDGVRRTVTVCVRSHCELRRIICESVRVCVRGLKIL